MRTGAFISNECAKSYQNKSLCNIFSEGLSILGVLTSDKAIKMKQAYPEWFQYFSELNLIKINIFENNINDHLSDKGIPINEENQI